MLYCVFHTTSRKISEEAFGVGWVLVADDGAIYDAGQMYAPPVGEMRLEFARKCDNWVRKYGICDEDNWGFSPTFSFVTEDPWPTEVGFLEDCRKDAKAIGLDVQFPRPIYDLRTAQYNHPIVWDKIPNRKRDKDIRTRAMHSAGTWLHIKHGLDARQDMHFISQPEEELEPVS